ncbi:MAG: hypothetical protein GXP42_07570 [Chloroflexi bacterium]|nr:hypothetical protein [Chloroflexota bacterium]
MPITRLHNLPWKLARVGRIPFDAALDDPAQAEDWLPASVPGAIQRDLMAAGLLPDLYRTLDLDEVLAWVDESDWWYRVSLPAISADERAWLRFEGIDYLTAVTLNGEELGRGAGMFAAREWEVTSFLCGDEAELGVRVWGGGALPRWPDSLRLRLARRLAGWLQGGLPAFDDRLLTLKAPLHFGWDFAPRLLAAGIWDDVILHTARGVRLADIWPRADWGPEYGLMIQVELDADRPRKVRFRGRLEPVNFRGEVQDKAWKMRAGEGRRTRRLAWPEAHLRPWSTHDRGFPHLYRLTLQIEDETGLLDERSVRVGARTIGWDGYGRAAALLLNGHRLRLRGVNWTSLDLLRGGEDEEARMRAFLQAAADAGVNAIRVWGGGGREREVFYDICDELGLLVWQELPIACVFMDHLPEDEAFLALARRETRGMVRKLRGHPSLMMWVGGNEWGPGRHKRLSGALSETVAQEDPSRLWRPASPGPGDSHNWKVWHGKAPIRAYAQDPAPLLSEFGLAAPPSVQTLAEMLPPDHLWPPGPGWRKRKAEWEKLRHYARLFLSVDPEQTDLETFVAASQEAQARGLQVGMESYRLREDGVGCFIWQWNEPWPAICWSVAPYWEPPKRAYEQVRRSYAPVAPLARILDERVELWVVNDRLDSPGPCVLTASIAGEIVWEGEVEPRPNEAVRVAVIPRPPISSSPRDPAALLTLHLRGPDISAQNDYPLLDSTPSPRALHLVAWLFELGKRIALRW